MNYFDRIIIFKTTAEGEIIYYPNGFWRKGFIVPTLEKKQELLKSVKRLLKIYFSFAVAIGISFSLGAGFSTKMGLQSDTWLLILGSFVIMLLIANGIWFQRSTMRLTQGLVKSNVSISMLESLNDSALSMNFIATAFLGMGSIYFAFMGFIMASYPQNHPWIYIPCGIFLFIISVLGCFTAIYTIVVKMKKYFSK